MCASDSIDEKDVSFTNMQIESFYKLLRLIKEKGIAIPKIHIQSSYGFLNYPELKCNYVRTGVALYGVLSSPNDKVKLQLDLRPVLSLKARVILLRQLKLAIVLVIVGHLLQTEIVELQYYLSVMPMVIREFYLVERVMFL